MHSKEEHNGVAVIKRKCINGFVRLSFLATKAPWKSYVLKWTQGKDDIICDLKQLSRIQGKGEDEITNWHIAHSRFHSMSRQRIHWILTAQSQLPKFSPIFHVGTNYKTRAPPEFHWSGQPFLEFAAFIVEIVWQLDFLCQSLPAVNEYLSGHKNWVYGNASSRHSCKYSYTE